MSAGTWMVIIGAVLLTQAGTFFQPKERHALAKLGVNALLYVGVVLLIWGLR